MATSNISKYYVGQEVSKISGGVSGFIVRITADDPTQVAGPGVLEVLDAPRPRHSPRSSACSLQDMAL